MLRSTPVRSRNRFGVPIRSSAALNALGAGRSGNPCSPTSGVEKLSGRSADVAPRRDAVETAASSAGLSGIGASSQRQNRVSSLTSQLLQLPRIASENTPRVGTLRRTGGGGSAL